MLAQLMHRVVIVAGDLVGQRQGGGIEDPGLGAEELEQARGFLDAEPRKGPLAQRSVEQQYARRRIARPQAQGWLLDRIGAVEIWKIGRISKRAQLHQDGAFKDLTR